MARGLAKRLLILVILALILPERLDALAALLGVEIATREREPRRLDAVLDAEIGDDREVIDAEVERELLHDRLAAGRERLGAGVVREIMFAELVSLAENDFGEVIDRRAADPVIVEDSDLAARDLVKPNRRVVPVAEIPSRMDG